MTHTAPRIPRCQAVLERKSIPQRGNAPQNGNVGFSAKLTTYFNALFSSSSASDTLITSRVVEKRVIRNPGDIVRELLAQEGTQA
jgi:hypothetical protein